ncbi:MAG: potassium-transporting ATPase subunit KdpC [Isosphaeraceae bacterium]|nr:potassium-transporting ATPase subunit KdpC [Isosphaeraceae bacterium]
MIRETVDALLACVVTFVLCALAYPAAVWAVGQATFPKEAEGSLIYNSEGKVIGSELIAQPFASDTYFFPRPSAVDYKADATGGSNLGTKNPDLHKKVAERAEALKATAENPVPVDLVTASGAGMDPHISPEGAYYQAARVATARKMPVTQVRRLIDSHVERSGAIIGAPPRVNVLRLNLDLDATKPEPLPPPVAAAPNLSEDFAAMRAQLRELSGQVERLGSQAGKQAELLEQDKGAQEKSQAGFQQVQTMLKGLSERLAGVGETSKLIARIDERVGAIEERVKGEADNLDALRTELDETRKALKATAAPLDLSAGIAALKEGRFAEASNAFLSLTKSHPEDARSWYLAAVARGLATKQWNGETITLVEKGVAREKAGTPRSDAIDSALSDLTPATGKDWLSHYRGLKITP